MQTSEFVEFLAGIASRLRHDLKGGLITLRMGLEALPEEEDLKPLLLERASHLESLSDKLVLLLRMGQMRPEKLRLSAVLGEFRGRAADRFPALEIALPSDLGGARLSLDGDALVYGLLEVAENASLAGATRLEIGVVSEGDQHSLVLRDNGSGPDPADIGDLKGSLAPLGVSRWGRAGLGLAIADLCARGHHGDLRLSPGNPGMEVVMRLGASA
jgi:signal transduction histidine kinase